VRLDFWFKRWVPGFLLPLPDAYDDNHVSKCLWSNIAKLDALQEIHIWIDGKPNEYSYTPEHAARSLGAKLAKKITLHLPAPDPPGASHCRRCFRGGVYEVSGEGPVKVEWQRLPRYRRSVYSKAGGQVWGFVNNSQDICMSCL
jgi:ribosomal protein L40E